MLLIKMDDGFVFGGDESLLVYKLRGKIESC